MLSALTQDAALVIAALDLLPDAVRGLLAALWLVALLWCFERLVVPRQRWTAQLTGYRWRIAHSKTALLVLLFAPLAVAAFPQSRIPVFVDVLPATASATSPVRVLLWLVVAWLLIAILVFALRARERRAARRAVPVATLLPGDQRLVQRAEHWGRQLGLATASPVCLAAVARPCLGGPGRAAVPVLVLPPGAAHWPAPVADVALIRLLCEHKLGHERWYWLALAVGALYWPFALVREGLARQLKESFNEEAWTLAAACFRDPLGFSRARRQLAERLQAPGRGSSERSQAPPLPDHDGRDPYAQVFVTFAQVLLATYLLTGLTLREIPDDSDFDYAEAVDDWYKIMHRAPEYLPTPPVPAAAADDPARPR
ncbi:MAG: hypothetical protein AAGI15_09580 [Pseudomonadota bacterium]